MRMVIAGLATSAAILLAGTDGAEAINRYSIEDRTCGEVQSIIANEGAAILRYRSDMSGKPLFDRYVASGRYCMVNEYADRETVPTSDNPRCPVLSCEYCRDDGTLLDRCGIGGGGGGGFGFGFGN